MLGTTTQHDCLPDIPVTKTSISEFSPRQPGNLWSLGMFRDCKDTASDSILAFDDCGVL
jgi:hypothetical protein